jgi:predicted RNA binding protein YcfA (HicA-like mRNA interferase family)
MSRLKNWSFQNLCGFLKDYGFVRGHCVGSHYYYNGEINGETVVIQAINSSKERESQSDKTMKLAVKHSGIPKEYFQEWKDSGKIHPEIMG